MDEKTKNRETEISHWKMGCYWPEMFVTASIDGRGKPENGSDKTHCWMAEVL